MYIGHVCFRAPTISGNLNLLIDALSFSVSRQQATSFFFWFVLFFCFFFFLFAFFFFFPISNHANIKENEGEYYLIYTTG